MNSCGRRPPPSIKCDKLMRSTDPPPTSRLASAFTYFISCHDHRPPERIY